MSLSFPGPRSTGPRTHCSTGRAGRLYTQKCKKHTKITLSLSLLMLSSWFFQNVTRPRIHRESQSRSRMDKVPLSDKAAPRNLSESGCLGTPPFPYLSLTSKKENWIHFNTGPAKSIDRSLSFTTSHWQQVVIERRMKINESVREWSGRRSTVLTTTKSGGILGALLMWCSSPIGSTQETDRDRERGFKGK